jgi:sigma-54 dependent transcriptional regulator, acetoin dehydrogenase operon transcriptional activator AcoR
MLRRDSVEHAERVYSSVRWNDAPYKEHDEDNRLLRSWERSLENYRLDPGRVAQPRILTSASLRDHLEPLESFLRIAKYGVRKLHERVHDANYVVLLTDSEGITIDYIGSPTQDRELKKAGLYLGSVWTESEEGTCGVGTAIIDKKPILVHKREHFRAPNTTLTCSSAPIFDVDGTLLSVLDASALYSPDDRKSQYLVLKFVTLAADMIENAHFLNHFKNAWVLQISDSQEFLQVETDDLIAFDETGAILGLNRRARQDFASSLKSTAKKIEDLFEVRVEQLITFGARNQQVLPLRAVNAKADFFAHVRPPENKLQAHERVRPLRPDAVPSVALSDEPAPAKKPATKLFAPVKATIDKVKSILRTPQHMENPVDLPERERIVAALRKHKWQIHATARALGMARATIYRKMAKYQIVSPNKAES